MEPQLSVETVIGGTQQRSLLKFDLHLLPPDVQVLEARLGLWADSSLNSAGNPQGRPMEVYRLTQRWQEGSVTWIDSGAGLSYPNWQQAGGDAVGRDGGAMTPLNAYAVNSTVLMPNFGQVNLTWDITQLVQEWVSLTYANNGLLLLSEPENWLHFWSKQAASVPGGAGFQPTLEIAFVPEPATIVTNGIVILAVGGAGLWMRARRKKT